MKIVLLFYSSMKSDVVLCVVSVCLNEIMWIYLLNGLKCFICVCGNVLCVMMYVFVVYGVKRRWKWKVGELVGVCCWRGWCSVDEWWCDRRRKDWWMYVCLWLWVELWLGFCEGGCEWIYCVGVWLNVNESLRYCKVVIECNFCWWLYIVSGVVCWCRLMLVCM